MQLIIISGPIGSGKSTVAKIFQNNDFYYLDSDTIAKNLISENSQIKKSLVKEFGNDILKDNKISFISLKSKLIESYENKNIIDRIVHPYFYKYINSYITSTPFKKIILEIPLISTAKSITHPYKVIVVSANVDIRLTRSTENNNQSKDSFDKINKLQKNEEFYADNSDYVIVNNGNINMLTKDTERVINSIINHE